MTRRTAPLLLLALTAPLLVPLVVGTTSPASAAPPPPAAVRATAPVDLGYDRIGVRRGDTWYLRPDLAGGPNQSYVEHTVGWVPVAGDTDGDGIGTVSLFRDGVWRMSDGSGQVREFRFGLPGDVPVLGDWDGDGVDTIGVFRRGRWYVRDANASGPNRSFGFGVPGDRPVVGDWDGDGGTDIGVLRGRQWYLRNDASNGPHSQTFAFGLSGDLPVAGDWDHDGSDTVGAFRGGSWFLRDDVGRYTPVRFGLKGDAPVVRRTPGLADGVRHQVVRSSAGFAAHVVTVDLPAASTPDVVLAGDRLGSTEVTSSMGRRSGAAVAVNGDYAASNGRPVHLFARDGELVQSPTLLGRALGLGLDGSVSMGRPALTMSMQPDGTTDPLPLAHWNEGQPSGDEVVAFTGAGAPIETPRANACYAGVAPADPVIRDGVVVTTTTFTGKRCLGNPPMVPPTGSMLTANSYSARHAEFDALRSGQGVTLRHVLGFPGAVDAIGGNPLLVRDGAVVSADVDGSGGYFGPNPRTAVGTTTDGRLLVVVVDGRAPGHSRGASLRELADLMLELGAVNALNLDGGGSSTMWLNGIVVNRPSDGQERGVSSALVVLPAGDPGETRIATQTSGAQRRSEARVTPTVPTRMITGPADSTARAQRDPGSTGGLPTG